MAQRRLVDFVRESPSQFLGATLVRSSRLRFREAWTITRVHPAKEASGNPTVWGVRTVNRRKAAAAGEQAAAAAAAPAASAAAPEASGGKYEYVAQPAAEAEVIGPLKPDWMVVVDPDRKHPERQKAADGQASAVERTSEGLRLSPASVAAAIALQPPFNTTFSAVRTAYDRARRLALRKKTAAAAEGAAEGDGKEEAKKEMK